jgi:hypothetical protein
MLDKMALIKGLPVIIGLALVIISFIAQFVPALSFLIVGQWLLHVGILWGWAVSSFLTPFKLTST